MRILNFMHGSATRRVIINERTVSFIIAELNFVPLTFNLDKLDEHQDKINKLKIDRKILDELSILETEEDMEKDVVNDFQKLGWRLMN